MRVLTVVGARPNFMKVAPIMLEMSRYPRVFKQFLVHTGQHYDRDLSGVFFDHLKLRTPDFNLNVGSGTHAQQTAKVMMAFEPVLERERPDWVVVVGDVNSTLACALTAAKMGVRVAHVEAGLRSFDRTMPEELNRTVVDHLADLLFTTEPSANRNLRNEGIPRRRVHFVGNVMIDALVRFRAAAKTRLPDLRRELGVDRYVLATLHRPSNVDDAAALSEILLALRAISRVSPVVFPVHPRTRRRYARVRFGAQSASIGVHLRFHWIWQRPQRPRCEICGLPSFPFRAGNHEPQTTNHKLVRG
jgi:UDP-N-acetylglucosamine 2-epimerase (non-hydrolysing)